MNMFWEKLKDILEYQNISLKELCAKAGLKQQSIYNAITRKTFPSLETAVKIANALNVSVEYLVTGKESQEISDEECVLLIIYRKLSNSNKKLINEIIDSFTSDS